MMDRSPDIYRPPAAGPPAPVGPPSPYVLSPQGAALVPADTRDLVRRLARIVRKQRWKLAHFIVTAMLLAVVLQVAFPRLYQATATLRLERHAAPGAIGQEASQISAVNDMDEMITTDMELAQSDPVVRPVAEKFGLLPYQRPPGLLARWFGPKRDEAYIKRLRTAPAEMRDLNISRPANTYLIRITYRTWGKPQLAADVANGISASLVEHIHELLDHSYTDLSSALRRDMDQLKAKMDASSRRLTQYEKDLKMVDPEQKSTILTSRLSQLLAEYTVAQADRLHREAILEGAKGTNTVAAAQATEAGGQRLSQLDSAVEKLATAKTAFTTAKAYYGENHPEYRKAKQQLDEAQAELEAARSNTGDRAAVEYRQALSRELLLKKQVDQAKAEVDALKTQALEYTQLKTEAENDRRVYLDLEMRQRESDVNRQFRDSTVQMVSPALPPLEPIFPKLFVNLPVALLLALVLGLLGSIAADALDTTFEDADDMSNRMQLAPVATLPEARALGGKVSSSDSISLIVRPAAASSGYEEAIRMLRNSIGLASGGRNLRTILVTSPGPGEGKSFTASQLAAACAQGGKKVLLIDADLRRPSLHRTFNIKTHLGLSDVLAQRILPVDVIIEAGSPGLFVMPAGPTLPNGSDLISVGFSALLTQVARNFDLVLVDAPPMLGLPETHELARMVDGVLVIAKADSTPAKALSDTLTELGRANANLLGVVMNQVKAGNVKGFGYYYRQQHEGERADSQA